VKRSSTSQFLGDFPECRIIRMCVYGKLLYFIMKTCNKGTAYCISSLEHVEKAGQMKLAGPCGIMGCPSLELSLTILNPCPHNAIRFALTKRSEIIAKANSEAQTPDKHPRGVSLLLLNTMTNIRTLRGRYCFLGHGRATSTASRDIKKAGQPRNLPSNALFPSTSGPC
jgi:hypothetical protein